MVKECFHFIRNEIPVVLFKHHLLSRLFYPRDLLGISQNFLDRLRNLLRRVAVHRPTGRLLIRISFRIKEEVRNTSFLRRDDRQSRRHRFDKGIAHALGTRRADEDIACLQIIRYVRKRHIWMKVDVAGNTKFIRKFRKRALVSTIAEHEEMDMLRQERQRANDHIEGILVYQPASVNEPRFALFFPYLLAYRTKLAFG